MKHYLIGIVEDDEKQSMSIRRTIKTNKDDNIDVEFKPYDISSLDGEIIKKIVPMLLNDIEEKKINFIIVDYKLLTDVENCDGVQIIDELKRTVKEFPMVILTERSDECILHTLMDPDKIYEKQAFFKCESNYSKDAVSKIIKNIDRYTSKTNDLNRRILDLKKKREEDKDDIETLRELIELEAELDLFYPAGRSEVNKAFDSNALKNIVDLIEQANRLLEG